MSLLIVLFSASSPAQDMRFLDVEDLTRISTHVFRGEVLSNEVKWADDHHAIYTSTRIRVDEGLKGPLSSGQIVTVNQLGGEIDGMKLDYQGRPIFTVGESVLLFTTEPKPDSLVVMALKQGKMRIEGDAAVRDLSGIDFVSSQSASRIPQKSGAKPQERIPLSQVRTRIARAK
jgi:hypothetical protein